MHVVHVIQRPGDGRAWETARAHAGEHRVTVVLLQDAVVDPPGAAGTADPPGAAGAAGMEVLAVERDMAARGLPGRHEAIGEDDLVELLFRADRVISW